MMKVSGLIEWVEVGQGVSPPKKKDKMLLNAFLARRRGEKGDGEEKIKEGGGTSRRDGEERRLSEYERGRRWEGVKVKRWTRR